MKTFIKKFLVYSIPAACSIIIIGETAAQDTAMVQFTPGKDNTLYEDSLGAFSNGGGSYFFVGQTAPQDNMSRRGLLAFNLIDSIPAGSQIISVELKLHMSKTIAGSESVNLHRVLADWGEGTSNAPGQEGGGDMSALLDATWIHTFYDLLQWNTPGGDYESTVSAATSVAGIADYTFGSTSEIVADVQLWLDEPDTNFGWILIGDESVASTAKRFDTKENGTASNHPVLTVNFVPPPCCVGIRGDVNNDGLDANILDLNFLINRIFRFGPKPACAVEADVNSDGSSANILDLNYLINRIFRLGPEPGPC